jgi:hypothetical protein
LKIVQQSSIKKTPNCGDVAEPSDGLEPSTPGVDVPVIHAGRVVTVWVDADGNYVPEGSPDALRVAPLTVKKYSDVLLIFLLKAAAPEKYRDRYHRAVSTHGSRDGAGAALPDLSSKIMQEPMTRALADQILTLLGATNEAV